MSFTLTLMAEVARTRARSAHVATDAEALVLALYHDEARNLVRMARFFVDNRDAAEDIVQEAFIRLARNVQRIEDRAKAAPYLRSIVLNLARDHNRRGLLSLRHQAASGREIDIEPSAIDDSLIGSERQLRIVAAVRSLPRRQRDCIVLRYFDEMGPEQIASTLGLSINSVKTHLRRGLDALELSLEDER